MLKLKSPLPEQPFRSHVEPQEQVSSWLGSVQRPFCWRVAWRGLPVLFTWGRKALHVGLFLFPKSLQGWPQPSWSSNRGDAPTPSLAWGRRCQGEGGSSSQQEQSCPPLPSLAERRQLPWPGSLRGHRIFSESPPRPPYCFIKGCCGFFGAGLSVARTSLNTAQWTWAPALVPPKLYPDADPGFGLGSASVLGTEPSEPVCVQAGSERNSHVSDL